MIEINWRGRVWLIDIGPVSVILFGLCVIAVWQVSEGYLRDAVFLLLAVGIVQVIREVRALL